MGNSPLCVGLAVAAGIVLGACGGDDAPSALTNDEARRFVERVREAQQDGAIDGCPLIADRELRDIIALPADSEIDTSSAPNWLYCDVYFGSNEDAVLTLHVGEPDGSFVSASGDELQLPDDRDRFRRVEDGVFRHDDDDGSDSQDTTRYVVEIGDSVYIAYGAVRSRPADVELETAETLAAAVVDRISSRDVETGGGPVPWMEGDSSSSGPAKDTTELMEPTEDPTAPRAAAPAESDSIRDVRLGNTVWDIHPRSLCNDGERTQMELIDGAWSEDYDFGATILDHRFGDVTGDGHDDAVVLIQCGRRDIGGFEAAELVLWRWDADAGEPIQEAPTLGWTIADSGELESIELRPDGTVKASGKLGTAGMIGVSRQVREPVEVDLRWSGTGLAVAAVRGEVLRAANPKAAADRLIGAARIGDRYEMQRYATPDVLDDPGQAVQGNETIGDCTLHGIDEASCSVTGDPLTSYFVDRLPGHRLPNGSGEQIGDGWVVTGVFFGGGM